MESQPGASRTRTKITFALLSAGIVLSAACSSDGNTTAGPGGSGSTSSAPPATRAPATSAPTTTEPPTTSTTAAIGPTDAVTKAALLSATPPTGGYILTVSNSAGKPIVVATGVYNRSTSQSGATVDLAGLGTVLASTPGLGASMASFLKEPVEVVSSGTNTYLRWSILGTLAGASTPWIQIAATPGSPTLGLPTADASGLLDGLGGAVGATEVGQETVSNAAVTHYTVTVDSQKSVATAPPARQSTVQGMLKLIGSPPTITFEIWVGADGYIKKMQTSVPTATFMSALGGSAISTIAGPTQLGPTLVVALEFTAPGKPVTIVIPPPADITVVDAAKLAALAGGGATPPKR